MSENIRPWGRYDILDQGEGFKVKRLTVQPGKRLSYQSHARRAEHWIIVDGYGRVTLDDVVTDHGRGEAVFVGIGVKHRIENIGAEPLVFIEIQTGDYFGEDDEIRHADDYGRT